MSVSASRVGSATGWRTARPARSARAWSTRSRPGTTAGSSATSRSSPTTLPESARSPNRRDGAARPRGRAVHRHRRVDGPRGVARFGTLARARRVAQRAHPARARPLPRPAREDDGRRRAGPVRRLRARRPCGGGDLSGGHVARPDDPGRDPHGRGRGHGRRRPRYGGPRGRSCHVAGRPEPGLRVGHDTGACRGLGADVRRRRARTS